MYSSNACQTPLLRDKQLLQQGEVSRRTQEAETEGARAYRRKQWLQCCVA